MTHLVTFLRSPASDHPGHRPGPHPGGIAFASMTAVAMRMVIASMLPVLAPRLDAADPPPAGSLSDGDTTHFRDVIRPLLDRYCTECHSTEKHKGDLDLERFATLADVLEESKVWTRTIEQIEDGEMPPEDELQPTESEKQAITGWVRDTLARIARSRATDPGAVVLRRLSNAEFTYTLRDLTGVTELDPAREFPVDGAAGEGFMNTGEALVMSPSLAAKYLDAAKEVADHAVLLPDGLRFSPHTTRRDWTTEILTRIQEFYGRYTDPAGATRVNLQGIVYDTNAGGRLPLELYLTAALEERSALQTGARTPEDVARDRGLSPKYLAHLLRALGESDEHSPVLAPLAAKWPTAVPGDAAALTAEVARWQQVLWRFNSVGHIGKVGGPSAWMEPVDPLRERNEFRVPLNAGTPGGDTVVVRLVATGAGDAGPDDVVVWERPRLVAPGRPDILVRDLRSLADTLTHRRDIVLADTAAALRAAAEAEVAATGTGNIDVHALAARHGVDPLSLAGWLEYLGLGAGETAEVTGHFTNTFTNGSGHAFINGWGPGETPNLVANSSDQHVRIPGNMAPHSVAVHPSPTLRAAVGWQSPVAASARVEARIRHAHPECGNGVTWALELRRGPVRRTLAAGLAHGAAEVVAGPIDDVTILRGDLLSLLVGPRDGNHACDLTAVDLLVSAASPEDAGAVRTWSLSGDVSGNVLAGNPQADRFGNPGVWHFYTEPDGDGGADPDSLVPPGSVVARWQDAAPTDRIRLAGEVAAILLAPTAPEDPDSPDALLYRQLTSLGSPLLRPVRRTLGAPPDPSAASAAEPASAKASAEAWGLDPGLFGRRQDPHNATDVSDSGIDPASLLVTAPDSVEIRIPADLAAGSEFVVEALLDPIAGAEGTAQVQVLVGDQDPGVLLAATGPFPEQPILVRRGSAAAERMETAFDAFRALFPAALCYSTIVPVDEVVTLVLYYREDEPLRRLMLDDRESAELDRLWDELRYVSRDALSMVDAYAQLMEYATQDADPSVFEPLRRPITERAAAFRERLVETEPHHVDAVVDFAGQAFRRPLSADEDAALRSLYRRLRDEDIPHGEAINLLIARVLVAPAFLYRLEESPPGDRQAPVSGHELATRLSYFLWSSAPDAELLAAAADGSLASDDPAALLAQTRRLLDHDRIRRLATEFACVWLHVYDFDELDEKSDRHFPTFVDLRGAMYEETIRFFTDLFRSDRSVLEILDADHAFLNGALAEHYGIPGIEGDGWRRVEGLRAFSRGGILGQATTLAKQSGASRTSPILRGNWITEVLLGERLPPPPADVPQLPEDEAGSEGLTVRQLTERHSSDPRCSGCHLRIDAFGYALESFDAIGRFRETDGGGRTIDDRVTTPDGADVDGIDGLRRYLTDVRRDDFLRQFCRKLLGYALGRSVQLSDEPLLEEMIASLPADGHRIGALIERIVLSPQFREIRCRDSVYNH